MVPENIRQIFDRLIGRSGPVFESEQDAMDVQNQYLRLLHEVRDPVFLKELMDRNRQVYLLPPDLIVATYDRILALGLRSPEVLRSFAFYLDLYGGPNWRPDADELAAGFRQEAEAAERAGAIR